MLGHELDDPFGLGAALHHLPGGGNDLEAELTRSIDLYLLLGELQRDVPSPAIDLMRLVVSFPTSFRW
ncbi:MAG: hypothetical protein ACR2KQ_03785 [Actinomycetota bacterium]